MSFHLIERMLTKTADVARVFQIKMLKMLSFQMMKQLRVVTESRATSLTHRVLLNELFFTVNVVEVDKKLKLLKCPVRAVVTLKIATAIMNAFDVELHFTGFSEVFVTDWTEMTATRQK